MNMIPFVMPWCGQTLGMPKSYVQDAGECTAQQTHLTSIGKGSRVVVHGLSAVVEVALEALNGCNCGVMPRLELCLELAVLCLELSRPLLLLLHGQGNSIMQNPSTPEPGKWGEILNHTATRVSPLTHRSLTFFLVTAGRQIEAGKSRRHAVVALDSALLPLEELCTVRPPNLQAHVTGLRTYTTHAHTASPQRVRCPGTHVTHEHGLHYLRSSSACAWVGAPQHVTRSSPRQQHPKADTRLCTSGPAQKDQAQLQ